MKPRPCLAATPIALATLAALTLLAPMSARAAGGAPAAPAPRVWYPASRLGVSYLPAPCPRPLPTLHQPPAGASVDGWGRHPGGQGACLRGGGRRGLPPIHHHAGRHLDHLG